MNGKELQLRNVQDQHLEGSKVETGESGEGKNESREENYIQDKNDLPEALRDREERGWKKKNRLTIF